MGEPTPRRARDKFTEPPDISAEFGQSGTPEFDLLNLYQHGTGSDSQDPLLAASNRLTQVKARYRRHVRGYRAMQHLGDLAQTIWQYPASPLSLHAPVVPPDYGELIAIERELTTLFADPARFSDANTGIQEALDAFEEKFQNYQSASKNGREVVRTVAKAGAMLPAAPLILGGAPILGAGITAVATAATHTAFEREEAALAGQTLSWSQLAAEAAESGGSAFIEVYILTKYSPYLVAKLPGLLGTRISDSQLSWLGEKMATKLSREQFVEALGRFTADVWLNMLSSGAATSYEMTFGLLRAKQDMSLSEFTSSLVANMLAAGGLQTLLGVLTHAKPLIRGRARAPKQWAIDDFDEPLRTQVAQLLLLQRVQHPHLAEPVSWHGTQPLELSGGRPVGHGGHAEPDLSASEIDRIMARVKAYAPNHFSPEVADLIVRDIENWRQNPVAHPRKRRVNVDASALLSQAQWIADQLQKAINQGYFASHKAGAQRAHKVVRQAHKLINNHQMSETQLDGLWEAYVEVLNPKEFQNPFQTQKLPVLQSGPSLYNYGHFGELSNNAAGVFNLPQMGYLAPGETLAGMRDAAFSVHDASHVNRLATEFAPSFPSYLSAVDRRIDFAEVFTAFKNLFPKRDQSLLETARFAARWENQWAPTAEHTWAATQEPLARYARPDSGSNRVVARSLEVLEEQGRQDVTREEMETIVSRLRSFLSAYLDSLPDGALRKRNALFQQALLKLPNLKRWGGPIVHLMARTGAPVPAVPQHVYLEAGKLTLSPEEFLVFLKDKDNELLHTVKTGEVPRNEQFHEPIFRELGRFVEKFISENPVPLTRS